MKFFCIAGPIKPEKHYYIPFDQRFSEEKLLTLIEQEAYFVISSSR